MLGVTVAFWLQFVVTSRDAELPTWQGVPAWKPPGELWILQEIVYKIRPDVIVETGTYKGGTALFFATLLDLQKRGKVVSIDIRDWQPKPQHDRVRYLIGSSTAPEIVSEVQAAIDPGAVVLVDLDSAHSKEHVLAELRAYADVVSVGSYIIVEDAKFSRTILPDLREGPGQAVDEFLSGNHNFVNDTSWTDRFGAAYPSEYLRRLR